MLAMMYQPYFSKTSNQRENLGKFHFLEIVSNSLPPIESSPNPNPMSLVDAKSEKEKTKAPSTRYKTSSKLQHCS